MNPIFVTFTGADDRTSVSDMQALAARYPIEWGVLMSPTNRANRFPSLAKLGGLTSSGLRLSAHLCGGYSRDVMDGVIPDLRPIHLGPFDRFQVNHVHPSIGPVVRLMKRCVLQCRSSSVFPQSTEVDWLYDKSGGRGRAPTSWPAYPGRLVGYSGGIGPGAVRDVISKIDADGPYWLDMESRVRTDDWFDLDKCEQVCREIWG